MQTMYFVLFGAHNARHPGGPYLMAGWLAIEKSTSMKYEIAHCKKTLIAI
jgi:hypothetical protein